MNGLFTAVGGTLENGMSNYVNSVLAALSGAIVPVVTVTVTVWIPVYGFTVIRGEALASVPAFAWCALRVAVILAFALGTGLYQEQARRAVEAATTGLAAKIQAAAATAGAGNAGCGSVSWGRVTGTSASAIYQTLACYDCQIDLVIKACGETATYEPRRSRCSGGDVVDGWLAGLGGVILLIVLAIEIMMARVTALGSRRRPSFYLVIDTHKRGCPRPSGFPLGGSSRTTKSSSRSTSLANCSCTASSLRRHCTCQFNPTISQSDSPFHSLRRMAPAVPFSSANFSMRRSMMRASSRSIVPETCSDTVCAVWSCAK